MDIFVGKLREGGGGGGGGGGGADVSEYAYRFWRVSTEIWRRFVNNQHLLPVLIMSPDNKCFECGKLNHLLLECSEKPSVIVKEQRMMFRML